MIFNKISDYLLFINFQNIKLLIENNFILNKYE
jgi:hypothetical protein